MDEIKMGEAENGGRPDFWKKETWCAWCVMEATCSLIHYSSGQQTGKQGKWRGTIMPVDQTRLLKAASTSGILRWIVICQANQARVKTKSSSLYDRSNVQQNVRLHRARNSHLCRIHTCSAKRPHCQSPTNHVHKVPWRPLTTASPQNKRLLRR